MNNIKLEAMRDKIEEILSNHNMKGLLNRQRCIKELLDLYNVSKPLGYDPDKECIVNGITCSDKDYQGWKMSSFETIEGYLHAIGK
jgi:hypothetical protein